MAIAYVLTEKGNPAKPQVPKKFYAQARSVGEFTLRRLSREISREISTSSNTVNDTDVLAILNTLTKVLKCHLDNGEIIRLGGFGSFQISVKSSGAETKDKFNASMIHSAKVNFRPGSDLKKMLKTLKYVKEDN